MILPSRFKNLALSFPLGVSSLPIAKDALSIMNVAFSLHCSPRRLLLSPPRCLLLSPPLRLLLSPPLRHLLSEVHTVCFYRSVLPDALYLT